MPGIDPFTIQPISRDCICTPIENGHTARCNEQYERSFRYSIAAGVNDLKGAHKLADANREPIRNVNCPERPGDN